MTTTIKVKCESAAHEGKGALVSQTYTRGVSKIAPGEEATFYLHDGNSISILEGDLPAAVEQAAGSQESAAAIGDSKPGE